MIHIPTLLRDIELMISWYSLPGAGKTTFLVQGRLGPCRLSARNCLSSVAQIKGRFLCAHIHGMSVFMEHVFSMQAHSVRSVFINDKQYRPSGSLIIIVRIGRIFRKYLKTDCEK